MTNYLKLGRNLSAITLQFLETEKILSRDIGANCIKYLLETTTNRPVSHRLVDYESLSAKIYAKCKSNYNIACIRINDKNGKNIFKGAYSTTSNGSKGKIEKYHFQEKNELISGNKITNRTKRTAQKYYSSSIKCPPRKDLEKLIKDGYTVTQIAKKYNIQPSTCYNWLAFSDLKIPYRTEKLESRAKLKEMLDAGYVVSEICEKLKISVPNYYSRLKTLGIVPPSKSIKAEKEANFIELVKVGYTKKEIMDKMDITSQSYFNLAKSTNCKAEKILLAEKNLNKIKELIAEGKTKGEIANILNLTEHQLRYTMQKHELTTLSKSRIGELTKHKLFELYEEHLSVDKIALITGISSGTIRKLLQMFDIIPPSGFKKITKERLNSITREQILQKKSARKICEELNISYTLFRRLKSEFLNS